MARSKQAKNWSQNLLGNDQNSRRHKGKGWWMQDPAPYPEARRRGPSPYGRLKTGPLGKRYTNVAIRCTCGRCWEGPTTRKNHHASQLMRTRETAAFRKEIAKDLAT